MNKFPGPNGQGDADRTLGNLDFALSQATIEIERHALRSRTATANAAGLVERTLTSVKRTPKALGVTLLARGHGVVVRVRARTHVAVTTMCVDAVVTKTFRHRNTDHFRNLPFSRVGCIETVPSCESDL